MIIIKNLWKFCNKSLKTLQDKRLGGYLFAQIIPVCFKRRLILFKENNILQKDKVLRRCIFVATDHNVQVLVKTVKIPYFAQQ